MKKFCWYAGRYVLCLMTVLFALSLCGGIFSWAFWMSTESGRQKPVYGKVNFSGTIYESSQVQPGTFAILKPWSEAEKWGKGAILSYQVLPGSVRCTAWIPNEETSGTFLKSEWQLSAEWANRIVSKTTFDPKTGTVAIIPIRMNRGGLVFLWLFAIVLVGGFWASIWDTRIGEFLRWSFRITINPRYPFRTRLGN
jgi:hypothetical protein